jgi:hypothetical protein
MPKPFMLGIEVEEIALGKVMRALNNMPGIVKLHMDLHPKAKKPESNSHGHGHTGKPRNVFKQSGKDYALEILAKGPMQIAKVRQFFIDDGRSRHSINSVLFNLKSEGLVELRDGNWSLTKKMKNRLRHRKEANG